MSLLFTNEEMATSSVRGKTKRPLDKQKMEAILGYNTCTYTFTIFFSFHAGFAINKYPTATSEYLIRQANDKLHIERKKYGMTNNA